MARASLFFLLGFGLMVGQASCRQPLPLVAAVPDPVLLLVSYLGVTPSHSIAGGAVLAFLLGYGADVLSSSPKGLFSLVYVGIFLLGRLAQTRLLTRSHLFEVLFSFVAATCAGTIVVIVRALAVSHIGVSGFGTVILQAGATAAVAPIVFSLARAIDRRTSRVPHDARRDVLEIPYP